MATTQAALAYLLIYKQGCAILEAHHFHKLGDLAKCNTALTTRPTYLACQNCGTWHLNTIGLLLPAISSCNACTGIAYATHVDWANMIWHKLTQEQRDELCAQLARLANFGYATKAGNLHYTDVTWYLCNCISPILQTV